ncbi:MAG: MBL fold metallo-hydrolase [Flavobacteriaceae bacterium]|nr:MBL fold metallo-hydrolase [Muriicola sp.]MBT8290579.1 MBL fold metallo-hydrolase [Muriicola sp.]NNK20224.1 MBL fold metallo-hydrolase [Flavobacteriaceae bacterium]NNK35776.1 MBL fold metallo-hydrolase [Eudoraea sp.]NNL38675.1 MBL fold metallo-hydrolase [Flavobacteriaceae bacterium]
MKTFFKLFAVLLLILVSCKEAKKADGSEAGQTDSQLSTQNPTEKDQLIITPVEHATAVIQWGDVTIYIDPVGGSEAFAKHPKPDLILITDIHGDHFNAETLEGLDTSEAKIMVPQAVADQMPAQFAPQLDILNNGDTKERFNIVVEAIPMYNLREEAKNFHVKGRGNGYVLNMGGQRLYFSGDTEDIPEMRALENIDKAFICMNLPYTMTVDSAADAVLEFTPKQVYPYHYRGRPDVSDVNQFASLVKSGDSNIEVVQLDWYPTEPY